MKNTFTRHQIIHLLALIAVLWTFSLSAIISRTVFERVPHLEDEVAYLYQARIFSRGHVTVETPQPKRAYWQPFVVDYGGQRFSKYTPGWSAVLTVGEWLGQDWWINAALAAISTALVFALGKQIFNPLVGLFAAYLVAFSPMAILLNATLMGHTTAFCFSLLFLFAYYRLERSLALPWAALAGFALGIVIIIRPLTALAIASPVIIWAIFGFLRGYYPRKQIILPLCLIAAVALIIALIIPLYSYITTGQPTLNLYTLVWEYDRIGFGECCGRHGHMLRKGFLHTDYDLSLTAVDLFGWQLHPFTPEMQNHLLSESTHFPGNGFSFVLIPVGVLIGLAGLKRNWRRSLIFLIWGAIAFVYLSISFGLSSDLLENPAFSWAWVITSLIGLLAPLALFTGKDKQSYWTWILWSIVLGIVLYQLTYWIGSQRYSTRYYYEALGAAALLTALPLAFVYEKLSKPVFRLLFALAFSAVLFFSFFNYSLPRVQTLYRFNQISPEIPQQVFERRLDDRPILAIITGPNTGDDRVRWRALGSLMVVTNPYLDSDIVMVWNYNPQDPSLRANFIAAYPDRQVIDLLAAGNDVWFAQESQP